MSRQGTKAIVQIDDTGVQGGAPRVGRLTFPAGMAGWERSNRCELFAWGTELPSSVATRNVRVWFIGDGFLRSARRSASGRPALSLTLDSRALLYPRYFDTETGNRTSFEARVAAIVAEPAKRGTMSSGLESSSCGPYGILGLQRRLTNSSRPSFGASATIAMSEVL